MVIAQKHVGSEFYIHGSVHRECILIRSNETQQYAGVDLSDVSLYKKKM